MTVMDFDVVIVGYGPVGQMLSALLGKAGHRVGVFERYNDFYPWPRAIRFDGEVMRLFQNLGMVAEIEDEIVAADHYLWFGADGDLILDIDMTAPSPSGWRGDYVFYQPVIEAALDRVARSWPTVEVERGWTAEALVQHDDHVELTLRQVSQEGIKSDKPSDATRVVRGRYLIGADGANSFVRTASGISWIDLGFAERWIVTDVRPHNMDAFSHLPVAAQHCDPRRPMTMVRNGKHHRRWEFMLLEGERPEDFTADPTRVWQLLDPYIKPDQGAIIRHAVYEFRSLIAETMQAGRVLLAGDAAHLMPPFMGEGMCAGIRDANNLAWKLDLILRGVATDALLASYSPERRYQNEVTIGISLAMGKVSCVLDVAGASARDAAFRSGQVPPPPPLPGIGAGIVHHGRTADPVAGQKAVQGRVEGPQGARLLDDVIGSGFAVICLVGDPVQTLGHDRMEFLNQIGAHVLTLDPSVTGALRDADGALSGWLTGHGLQAIISRPDYYAFGGVQSLAELPMLVDDLRDQLILTRSDI